MSDLKICKTCDHWEPFQSVCCNIASEKRFSLINEIGICERWEKHRCPHCGGTLMVQYSEHRVYYVYHCLSCHFEFKEENPEV